MSTVSIVVNENLFIVEKGIYDRYFVLADVSEGSSIFKDLFVYTVDVDDNLENIKDDVRYLLKSLDALNMLESTNIIFEGSFRGKSLLKTGWRYPNSETIIQFVDKYIKDPKEVIKKIIPEIHYICWALNTYDHSTNANIEYIADLLTMTLGHILVLRTFVNKKLEHLPFIYPLELYNRSPATHCNFDPRRCTSYSDDWINRHISFNKFVMFAAVKYIFKRGEWNHNDYDIANYMNYAITEDDINIDVEYDEEDLQITFEMCDKK